MVYETRSHMGAVLMPFFMCRSSRSLPRALQCESRGSAGGQGSERDREEVLYYIAIGLLVFQPNTCTTVT